MPFAVNTADCVPSLPELKVYPVTRVAKAVGEARALGIGKSHET